MANKGTCGFGYYFLNKRLTQPAPIGFRTSVINVIINKNDTKNKNKILFVQQSSGFWGIPKEGLKGDVEVDALFPAVARAIEEELGLRGTKASEAKPLFAQIALLFNFDRQVYDKKRSRDEKKKGRPTNGKNYHLAIMSYTGPDVFPIERKRNAEIINFKWVTKAQGKKIMLQNKNKLKGRGLSIVTFKFNARLYDRILRTLTALKSVSKTSI